jgi:hypothetical protein
VQRRLGLAARRMVAHGHGAERGRVGLLLGSGHATHRSSSSSASSSCDHLHRRWQCRRPFTAPSPARACRIALRRDSSSSPRKDNSHGVIPYVFHSFAVHEGCSNRDMPYAFSVPCYSDFFVRLRQNVASRMLWCIALRAV